MFALKQLRFREQEGPAGGWVPIPALHPWGSETAEKLHKFLVVIFNLFPWLKNEGEVDGVGVNVIICQCF